MYWKMWYGRQADTLDEAMREAREVDWRYDPAQPMTDEEAREAFAGRDEASVEGGVLR